MKTTIKSLLFVSIVQLITVLYVFFPDVAHASNYFEDNFDNDLSKWIAVRGSINSWQIQDGRVGTNTGDVLEIVPKDEYWQDSFLDNYRYELDMYPKSGVDKNISFRFQSTDKWNEIHHTNDTYGWYRIYLERVFPNNYKQLTSAQISNTDNISIENNKSYHFRIDVLGERTRVFINEIGQPESELIDYIDSGSPLIGGKIGLKVGQSEVWFDNVVVTKLPDPTATPTATSTATATTTPEPTSTPTTTATASPTPFVLNVPDLKQYSLPWKNKTYANTTKTIGEYGCALTSMSMILKYHGHNIDPQELNRWLKNQPDGYIRNGLLNWLAVTRYTKENDRTSSPSLEFKRLSGGLYLIDSELLNNRPSILKVPGHFIVVKGKNSQGEYLINDPGYKNRTLLSSYQNKYLSLNSFTPSHTNLSYIMLVVNPSITVEVVDENGNVMPATEIVEEPIVSTTSSKPLGEALKIVYLEKPEKTKYQVKLSKSVGKYKLNTYLYDKNGNVKSQEFSGKLNGSDIDIYNLNIKQPKNRDYEKRFYLFGRWFRYFLHSHDD